MNLFGSKKVITTDVYESAIINKCSSLSLIKGEHAESFFSMGGKIIPQLASLNNEIYLGIPIGLKFLFSSTKELGPKLNSIADSALAPWQKLEILRSLLLPSFSHNISSGRIDKSCLSEIDKKVKNFLRLVTKAPDTAATPIFHANHNIDGNMSTESSIRCLDNIQRNSVTILF